MTSLRSDEAGLLRRVAAGDDEAFAVFYRAHLDAVVAFFRRRVGDRELAFDLTAETFAAVVVGAGAYNGDAPPVAWLFGIARNKLRESLRRERVADAARRRLGMEPIALDDTPWPALKSAPTVERAAWRERSKICPRSRARHCSRAWSTSRSMERSPSVCSAQSRLFVNAFTAV